MSESMAAVMVTVLIGNPEKVKFATMRMMDLTNVLREEQGLEAASTRMDVNFNVEDEDG